MSLSSTLLSMPTKYDCFCASGAVEFVYQAAHLTFDTHLARAENMGYTLASYRNAGEKAAALQSLPRLVGQSHFFIGLVSRVDSSRADFEWVDGTPYDPSFNSFFRGEPDGSTGSVVVQYHGCPGSFQIRSWDDEPGDTNPHPAVEYKCCSFGTPPKVRKY
jgi:hypothetical protein